MDMLIKEPVVGNDVMLFSLEDALAARNPSIDLNRFKEKEFREKMLGCYNRRGRKLSGQRKWVSQKKNTGGKGGLPSAFPLNIANQAAQRVYEKFIIPYKNRRLQQIQEEQQFLQGM